MMNSTSMFRLVSILCQELVSHIIRLCRSTPSKSLVRLYALNLLVNISVQENLHGEFIKNMSELNALIESSWQNQDEALSVGKLLVNLSTNKNNVESLFKLTVNCSNLIFNKSFNLFASGN